MKSESNKWDQRFIELAFLVASWSKDPSTKVGAVIVDEYKRVVSTGYNGLPRGTPDDAGVLNDREVKNALIVHAEVNAILFAQRSLSGCVLYTTHPPCCRCSGLIVQSGIGRVVTVEPQLTSLDFVDRWSASAELARRIYGKQVTFDLTER